MNSHALETIIIAFETAGIKASQFVLTLLTYQQFNDHTIVRDLLSHSNDILAALLKHPSPSKVHVPSASHLVQEICTAEVRRLAPEDSGSHFGASSATTKQLEDFSIEDMAQEMIRSAPEFWALLGVLLGEGEKCLLPVSDEGDGDGDAVMGDSQSFEDDDSYWDQVEAVNLEGFITGLASENVSKKDLRSSRRSAIIKTVSIMSGFCLQREMQSIIGIFLQSAHTPQNVIDTLARIGISISTDAINAAVKSLSAESQNTIRDLGQTLLASYAYDNFDVDLKSHVPVAEKSNDSLKHLTSGLIFPLQHGVTVLGLNFARGSNNNSQTDILLKPLQPAPHMSHSKQWWEGAWITLKI